LADAPAFKLEPDKLAIPTSAAPGGDNCEMKRLRAVRTRCNKTLLVIFIFLTSCDQDDRTITVTCDTPPGTPIAVVTEWSDKGIRKSATGYLNNWGFSIGTIVRVSPGSTPLETIIERQASVLPLLTPTSSPTTLTSATVGDGFQVHLEDDVRAIGRQAGIDLESGIPAHTMLSIDAPEVHSLTNLANSINAYPGIVKGIRTDRDAHFAIVSGTIDGDYPFLFSTYGSAAVNTLWIETSYVHISYSCRAIEELRHRSWAADNFIPLIIYLTPIRYDETTSQISIDPDSLDRFTHN
jgi:hypothetical protein